MRRIVMGAAVGTLALLIPVFAADKELPATHNPAAASAHEMIRSAWPPEMLSGKIMTVDPAQKLVIVQDAKGVPFDMRVTGSTRIRSGKQALNLDALKEDLGKPVSVRFRPERSGDIAQSIRVLG